MNEEDAEAFGRTPPAVLALILLAIVGMAFALGCGHSADITTPTSSPPPPNERLVVVAVTGVQNGAQGVTTVAAGSDFKVNATASRCYVDKAQVACNTAQFSIPYWSQRQTGGSPCESKGDINSASVQYSCPDVGPGHTFEACAMDFDKANMGCGVWEVTVF